MRSVLVLVVLVSQAAFATEYSQMTREQLLRERARLVEARPSWTPNVLLLVLDPTVGTGLTVALTLVTHGANNNEAIGLGLGIGIQVIGIIAGIVLHAMRGGERRRANVEINIIDDLLDSGQPLPAQPGPPPPPPPPAALIPNPSPSVAVLAF